MTESNSGQIKNSTTFREISTYVFSSMVATTLGTIAGHPLDTVIVSSIEANYCRLESNMRFEVKAHTK